MPAQSGLGFSGIAAIQIPDAGATGQQLTKLSPEDYDYDWAAGTVNPTVDAGTVDDSILRWVGATPAWEEFLAYILPLADGTAQQIIETDGAGTLTFVDPQAGGGLLSAEYRFSTSTVAADPGSGRYRFDTASFATVTEIFIDDETSGGVDISNLLAQIGLGDRLYFQVKTESNKFVVFDVTGPAVDNTGWFTIPVDEVVFGDFFANNDRCIFIWSVGGTPETLQRSYNEDPTVPQITVNGTPEPLTIDASVAGDIFAVRDVANADVIRITTTGITFFGDYSFPIADGAANEVLNTDGAGALSFSTIQRKFFETMGVNAFVFSEFMEPTVGFQVDGLQGVPASGGFLSVPTAAYDFTNHPGVWGLNTGTAGTAGRVFLLSIFGQAFHVGVGGITRHGIWYQAPAILSDAVNEYVLRAGFSSISLPNTINQGITFEYQFDQNGGRWQALTEDGVAETTVDTGVTVVVSTYYLLEFEVNAAGTSVEYFIDGVSVATIVTNIPTGLAFEHFVNEHIMKLAGTANRASYVDAYYFYQEVTR